jgi:hypothetical protein
MKMTAILGLVSLLSFSAFADTGLKEYASLIKLLKAQRTLGVCQLAGLGKVPGGTAMRIKLKTGQVSSFLLNDPAQSPETKVVFDRQAGTFDLMDSNAIGWEHQVFRIGSNGQIVSFIAFQTIGGTQTLFAPVQVICQ